MSSEYQGEWVPKTVYEDVTREKGEVCRLSERMNVEARHVIRAIDSRAVPEEWEKVEHGYRLRLSEGIDLELRIRDPKSVVFVRRASENVESSQRGSAEHRLDQRLRDADDVTQRAIGSVAFHSGAEALRETYSKGRYEVRDVERRTVLDAIPQRTEYRLRIYVTQ